MGGSRRGKRHRSSVDLGSVKKGKKLSGSVDLNVEFNEDFSARV